MRIVPIESIKRKDSEDYFCKICFEKGTSKRKLIRPCKCDGSIKYVHQDCLKKWRYTNINQINRLNNDRKIKCEICNYMYVIDKKYKNEDYYFRPIYMSFKRMFLEFIILVFMASCFSFCYFLSDTYQNNTIAYSFLFNDQNAIEAFHYLEDFDNTSWKVYYYFPIGAYTMSLFSQVIFLILPLVKINRKKLYYKLIYKHYLLYVFLSNFYLYACGFFYLEINKKLMIYAFLLITFWLSIIYGFSIYKCYLWNHDSILDIINNKYNKTEVLEYIPPPEKIEEKSQKNNENAVIEKSLTSRELISLYNQRNIATKTLDFQYNPLNSIDSLLERQDGYISSNHSENKVIDRNIIIETELNNETINHESKSVHRDRDRDRDIDIIIPSPPNTPPSDSLRQNNIEQVIFENSDNSESTESSEANEINIEQQLELMEIELKELNKMSKKNH